jgi:hypothetical protein
MDALLFRLQGLLQELQMRGIGDYSYDLQEIEDRIKGQDEKLANIRCLKCGHSASLSITIGKQKRAPEVSPYLIEGKLAIEGGSQVVEDGHKDLAKLDKEIRLKEKTE